MNEQKLRDCWPETQHDRWMDTDYEPGLASVVIPTYNRDQFIIEAMDSVWQQTYRPVELIVVDDGSTDDTPAVVDRWIKSHADDPDFETRYYRQENSGAPAARNLGIIMSNGEYIQYLDSDDLILPKKVEEQFSILASESTVGYVYCRAQVVRSKISYMGFDFNNHGLADMMMNVIHQTAAPLYRRSMVYSAGPWNESLRGAQDWEYSIRALIAANFSVVYQSKALVKYRPGKHTRIGNKSRGGAREYADYKASTLVYHTLRQLNLLDGPVRKKLVQAASRASLRLLDGGYYESAEQAVRFARSIAIGRMQSILAIFHNALRVEPRIVRAALPLLRYTHRKIMRK